MEEAPEDFSAVAAVPRDTAFLGEEHPMASVQRRIAATLEGRMKNDIFATFSSV